MKIHETLAYLTVDDAAAAIDFYTRAFGATETFRLTGPDGRVGHAQMDFGGTKLLLAPESPDLGILGPPSRGGTTVRIHLHVDDCDAVLAQAETCGGEVVRPAHDQFYGERSGNLRDPFGHEWQIGHTIEELTPEEMQRRYMELMTS